MSRIPSKVLTQTREKPIVLVSHAMYGLTIHSKISKLKEKIINDDMDIDVQDNATSEEIFYLIVKYLNEKLSSGLIKTRVLCARARLNETKDWDSLEVSDPNNFPFYYHLGSQIACKNVLEFGFDQGLAAACLVQGCNKVEKYAGFQLTNSNYYYSFRLGAATLKEYFPGTTKFEMGDYLNFQEFIKSDKWDLVLLTESLDISFYKELLNNIWDNLKEDGYLVVNNLSKLEYYLMFMEFCSNKNKKSEIYATRGKIGIVRK